MDLGLRMRCLVGCKMDELDEPVISPEEQARLNVEYEKLTRQYDEGEMVDILYVHHVFRLIGQGFELDEDRMRDVSLLADNLESAKIGNLDVSRLAYVPRENPMFEEVVETELG